MSDDNFDFEDATPEGLKSLRKAYEKIQNELKAERESAKDLRAFKRTHGIAAKLTELGAKPGLAELVPESVEVENVGQWLTEKADLFGWKPQSQSEPNPANDAEAGAQSRISQLSNLPGESPEDGDLSALYEAKSAREITELILARQMGTR